MRERIGGRRVGEVVRGHVDRLHRRDRALGRRRDALLQLAHLGRQGRLVAHGARHAAEQRRDLGARLHEPEDVVDEEQHVLAALVAEVLGHRQAAQADAQPRAGRLVHLAVDERGLLDHARLGHLTPEVVALARALAHSGEHRETAVLGRDVVDQLLDEHGLAHACAAEEADLAALDVRREQVDHLDARLEDLGRRGERLEGRRIAVDLPARRRVDRGVVALVDRLTEHVEDAPERGLADGDADRRARVVGDGAARQAVGGIHGDGADAIVAEMLLHLGHERAAVGHRDLERVVDRRQVAVEHGVEHDALDFDDPPGGTVLSGQHALLRQLSRGARTVPEASASRADQAQQPCRSSRAARRAAPRYKVRAPGAPDAGSGDRPACCSCSSRRRSPTA